MSRKKCNTRETGWQEALEVAKTKLWEGKMFVAKMRAAVQTIERKLAAGEPWPGSERKAS